MTKKEFNSQFLSIYPKLKIIANKFAFMSRYEPTDLVHDTYIRCYYNFDQNYNERSRFTNWVIQVMRNISFSQGEKSIKYRYLPISDYENILSTSPRIFEENFDDKLSDALVKTSKIKPNKKRIEILFMRVLSDKTTEEVSRELSIGRGTVMSSVFRVNETIRRFYHEEV